MVRTVLSISLSSLVFPLTTLLSGPLLARTLGPEGRGVVAALLAPLSLANLMFTLGVPDSLTYFVARHRFSNEKAIPIAMFGGILCSLVACATFWFCAPYLFRTERQYLGLFRVLLLGTLPFSLIFAALRGIVQGRQQFGLINKERIAAAGIRLAALFVFLLGGFLTPVSAVWISVISPLIGSIFLLGGLRAGSLRWRKESDTGQIARYATAAAMGTIGGLIVIRLDQALMVSLTSRSQLAYYAVAASVAELPLILASAVRDLAFSLASERDDPTLVAQLCRFTLLTMSVLCIFAGLFTPLMVPALFGKAFSPTVPMVEILLVASIGRAVTAVIGAGLMTTGRTWLRSAIQLAGAALTGVLLFIWVPRFGGLGAAWVTSITYAVLSVASTLLYVYSTGVSLKECWVPSWRDVEKMIRAVSRDRWNQNAV
jgi:O-antigen/teichoic acid export membrane protein